MATTRQTPASVSRSGNGFKPLPDGITKGRAGHANGNLEPALVDTALHRSKNEGNGCRATPCACGCEEEIFPDAVSLHLQHLIDQAGIFVLELDAEGRVARCNTALEQLLNQTLADLRGQDWTEVMLPESIREEARSICMQAAWEGRENGHVLPVCLKDGSLRQIEWTHSNLRNAEGAFSGILCIGRDVTDLQVTREALATAEQRARGVLETAVNAIVTINEECVIEDLNPATERIFGYSREELLGRNVSLLMPQPYRDRHDSYVAGYIKSGVKKIIGIGREAIAQRKDGSVFPIDLSVGEVILNSGRRLFTGIIRDLSDRKVLEDKILQISEEEQHRIGQDIHDDLCQQLAAIGCLAKVVHQHLDKQSSPEAENVAEIVRLITGANVRAREMSRGLMPVVLDSAGLMAALSELASGTERIFRVSCPFRCDPPVQVQDNKLATQLYRIAQEAVANAIKHSRADRIEITLSLADGHIVMQIRDNGSGIPDNVSGKSTGMGLLTMNHRARMLGGRLSVEHDEFGGTLVRCSVPVPPDSIKLKDRRKSRR